MCVAGVYRRETGSVGPCIWFVDRTLLLDQPYRCSGAYGLWMPPTELPVPDEVRAVYVSCAHQCVSAYAHQICASPCAYELLMMGLVCIHAHCMILAYRCVSIGRAMPSRRSCLICITSSGNTSASHRATPPLQRPSSRPRSLWRAGRGRRRYRARITTLRIRCTKRRPRLNKRTTIWRWHPNIKDTRQWHPKTCRWHPSTLRCKCRTIRCKCHGSSIRCKCSSSIRPRRRMPIWRWHHSTRRSHHSSTRRWLRSILRCKCRTTQRNSRRPTRRNIRRNSRRSLRRNTRRNILRSRRRTPCSTLRRNRRTIRRRTILRRSIRRSARTTNPS